MNEQDLQNPELNEEELDDVAGGRISIKNAYQVKKNDAGCSDFWCKVCGSKGVEQNVNRCRGCATSSFCSVCQYYRSGDAIHGTHCALKSGMLV